MKQNRLGTGNNSTITPGAVLTMYTISKRFERESEKLKDITKKGF